MRAQVQLNASHWMHLTPMGDSFSALTFPKSNKTTKQNSACLHGQTLKFKKARRQPPPLSLHSH